MRAGPPIQWSHWKKWGDDGEMFSQSFRLNNSSFVGQWISQWDAAKVYKSHVTVQRNRVGIQDPSLLISLKIILQATTRQQRFYCTGRDTPITGSHLTAAESDCDTHTHIHTHTRYKFTLKESILINAGLALNTGGRPSWTTELTLHLRGVHVHKRDRDG